MTGSFLMPLMGWLGGVLATATDVLRAVYAEPGMRPFLIALAITLLLRSCPRLAHLWIGNWYVREAITVTIPGLCLDMLRLWAHDAYALRLVDPDTTLGAFLIMGPSMGLLPCLIIGTTLSRWLGPRWLRRLLRPARRRDRDPAPPTRTVTVRTPHHRLTLPVPTAWQRHLIHPRARYSAGAPSLHGGAPTRLTVTTTPTTPRGHVIHHAPTTIDGHPATHRVTHRDGAHPRTIHQWTLTDGTTITLTHADFDTRLAHPHVRHLVDAARITPTGRTPR